MIHTRRSTPAPASLKATKTKKRSYTGADVHERLDDDFDGKCYLCEGAHEGSFQIEHLRPRAAYPGRKFSWTNLFPAHGDCNQRRKSWGNRGVIIRKKHQNWPVGGMLDPCLDDIEGRLKQWIEPNSADCTVYFEATTPGDTEATNTAEELNHLHRGATPKARLIRTRLNASYSLVLERLLTYVTAADPTQIAASLRELRYLVSTDAQYAGVIRGTLRRQRRQQLLTELGL